MSRRYTGTDLKAIGKQCGNKLPPASAVQAMFLYEMQRDAELQTLFQGKMFQLAKAETARDSRIVELEKKVTMLQQKIMAKDINERPTTSKAWTDALHSKLDLQAQGLDSYEARVAAMEAKINTVASDRISEAAKKSQKLDEHAKALESMEIDINKLDNDVQVLFDERDALMALQQQASNRIDKLEGLIKALTLQKSSHGSDASSRTGSPSPTQLLPVKTPGGDLLDLAVPKGKPLVPHKKDGIRTFTPGKQWMF